MDVLNGSQFVNESIACVHPTWYFWAVHQLLKGIQDNFFFVLQVFFVLSSQKILSDELGCHLQKTSQTYLFDLASPPPSHRHRCAQRPVDVTEWLQRLHIWTPMWQLCHWAWLRRGYWRYRNLIWLIDSLIDKDGKDKLWGNLHLHFHLGSAPLTNCKCHSHYAILGLNW